MAEKWVKICPKCNQARGVLEPYCPLDGYDLMNVRKIALDTLDAENPVVRDTAEMDVAPGADDDRSVDSDDGSEGRTQRAFLADEIVLVPRETPDTAFTVLPGQVVGRSVEADVTLRNLSGLETVSRKHARFTLRGAQWFVQHVAVTNYNIVDGDRHSGDEEVAVYDGSEISMAGVAFTVRIGRR